MLTTFCTGGADETRTRDLRRDRTAEQPSSRLFLQYTGVLHHFEAPHNVSRVKQRPHISHTTLLAHILLQEDYWQKKPLEGATSRVNPTTASNYRVTSITSSYVEEVLHEL